MASCRGTGPVSREGMGMGMTACRDMGARSRGILGVVSCGLRGMIIALVFVGVGRFAFEPVEPTRHQKF